MRRDSRIERPSGVSQWRGKFLFSLLMAALLGFSWSKETTLFNHQASYGAYAGPIVKFSPANGEGGGWFGMRVGVIVNSTFSLGIEGYGLGTPIKARNPDTANLMIGVMGLTFEEIFFSDRLIHGTASLLIGSGGVGSGRGFGMGMFGMGMMSGGYGNGHDMGSVFVLEPGLNMELNVAPYFRLCPGISYRWLSGDVQAVKSAQDVSNVSLNVLFKFGRF